VTLVRARRCPGAIAAMWGWQTALGLVVAWPAASVVARAFGGDSRGDAALWEAGGHPLLALLERHSHVIVAELTFAGIALLFAAVAGLLPMAALMVVLVERSGGCKRAAAYAAARAVGAFPALAVLLFVAVLAQAAAAGLGYLLAKLVELFAASALSEARAGTIEVLVVVPVALVMGALAIVHDLARAAAVRFRLGAARATSLAAQALRRAPWSTVWGWSWREGASLCVVIGGSLVAGALGGRRGLALVVLTVAHQATIAARVALRASWLAKALRTVAE
jgi:hypothetical protein